MSKNNDNSVARMNKMKYYGKKKIWPSVVGFFLFSVVSVALIAAYSLLFVHYLVETKFTDSFEDATSYVNEISAKKISLADLPDMYAGKQFEKYDFLDLCLADLDGHIVYNTGKSKPLVREKAYMNGSREHIICPDSEETGFNAQTGELFQFTMGKPSGMGSNKEIVSIRYWIPMKTESGKHILYLKYNLSVVVEDLSYVILVGIVSAVLLLIPLIFLFVNIISSFVSQRKMSKLLYMDYVTGGNNWMYFKSQTDRLLRRSSSTRITYAIAVIHLNKYNNFTACCGTDAGERLLERMDVVIKNECPPKSVVAHYGISDFVVAFPILSEEKAKEFLQYVMAKLSAIRQDTRLTFHAGYYMEYPRLNKEESRMIRRKSTDIDGAVNCAFAAMKTLTGLDYNVSAAFSSEMLDNQIWERHVLDAFDRALEQEEFYVYLQPKYNPQTDKLVGAEALVRWINQEDGFVPPYKFIPILEENGAIVKLDDYMISHVSKILSEWISQGKKVVPVSVNVSRAHFSNQHLAEHICKLVDQYQTPHDVLELELTESAFFDDKKLLLDTIKNLQNMGFSVSMDDFGSGYSSLNSLKDLPLNVLKLDGEFFRGDEEERGKIIVEEAIHLGKMLQMQIVAEGVEKKDQVDFLASQGCDMIQGYYYAKPMPLAEFEEQHLGKL